MVAARIIPAGTRFGRLTVTADRLGGQPEVLCRCDCGTKLAVKFNQLGVRRNSCGCLRRETTASLKFRHGMAGTRIYYIWADMVARCTRPNHARFADYGGRGITVCPQWMRFEGFYGDMGDRPEGQTLDRRDNDAGYSPENCRWASPVEQRANRRPQRPRATCKAGHPYSPDAPIAPRGSRRCLACERRWATKARNLRRTAA